MRTRPEPPGGIMFISLHKQNVIEWLGILSNDDNSPLVLINAPCLLRALQGVRGDF